jgi:hypothetical protein
VVRHPAAPSTSTATETGMASHGGTTTDHDEIRRWAEERGARPARVKRTGDDPEVNPGIIRLDFTGHGGQSTGALEEITWDEWFQGFEDSQLAFVHQDETRDGEQSNFNRLIGRETAERREHGDRTSRREDERQGRASPRRGANPGGARKGARKTATKTGAKRASRTATETASRGTARGASTSAGGKSSTKTAAKKSTAKKSPAKKSTAKKAAAKGSPQKGAAKKGAAKKTAAKKSPAKAAARKSTASKSVSRGATKSTARGRSR